MKIMVIYRKRSDHARQVEEFVREFPRQHQDKIKLVSIDSREGYATASLYDVVQYPAVLVTTDFGQMMKLWQGRNLPLKDEVAYFATR